MFPIRKSGSFTLHYNHTCPAKAEYYCHYNHQRISKFLFKERTRKAILIFKIHVMSSIIWENEVHRVEKELDDYKKRNNIDESKFFGKH